MMTNGRNLKGLEIFEAASSSLLRKHSIVLMVSVQVFIHSDLCKNSFLLEYFFYFLNQN